MTNGKTKEIKKEETNRKNLSIKTKQKKGRKKERSIEISNFPPK
jgi:hypothetical protein